MKKVLYITFIVLNLLFMNTLSVFAAPEAKAPAEKKNYTQKEFTTQTTDRYLIKSYLSYPKTKLKGYPVIIMLHSLGYNSTYWIPLQQMFIDKGFAVLRIDLRGHGKSVYDASFHQRSWRAFKNDTFVKYPQDVVSVIKDIQKSSKIPDFNRYALIGSDIGANTAILVAKELKVKPKALVLISPSMSFKGLYVPIALTEIGLTPILALASKTDLHSIKEQEKIIKFAQGTFDVYNTQSGYGGILMLKQHPEVMDEIFKWTIQYFK